MTFAFGHIIGAWIVGKLYERVRNENISHYTWFFLLFGGIFPDIDFILDWALGTQIHRTITHSLLFILGSALLMYVFFTLYDNFKTSHKKENCQFALAFGVGMITHITIDFFSLQGVPLLWPSPLYFSVFGIGGYDSATSLLGGSVDILKAKVKLAVVDMALGTAWILYLWWRKRIKF